MSRVYPRKFDHEEARRRWLAGESQNDIAADYGVSASAVQYACRPDKEACRGKQRRNRVGVRGGVIVARCGCCQQWKPLELFPGDKTRLTDVRPKGVSGHCRACHARKRQAYRNRHKIPCARCGRPRLPAREIAAPRRGIHDTGLCRACFIETLNASKSSVARAA